VAVLDSITKSALRWVREIRASGKSSSATLTEILSRIIRRIKAPSMVSPTITQLVVDRAANNLPSFAENGERAMVEIISLYVMLILAVQVSSLPNSCFVLFQI
jgi:hypothetical protein